MTNKTKDTNKKKWGYRQGLFVVFAILLLGFGIEIGTAGAGIPLLSWPYNIIVGVVVLNLLAILHISAAKTRSVRWLSSIPAAISALSLLTFLVLLMGFISQNDANASTFVKYLGLSHLTRSWVFALAQVFFLLALGLVTLRRATPLSRKNIGFLLNHAGLWITVTAAVLGAGDLKRFYMNLEEKADFTNIAYDQNGNAFQLKIALKLNDFQMQTYPPKLALFNSKTGEILKPEGETFVLSEKNAKGEIGNWQITVKQFLSDAFYKDKQFYEKKRFGSAPAAYLEVENTQDQQKHEGWVSCGGVMVPPVYLDLNNDFSIAMFEPEAKKYLSEIEYVTKEMEHDSLTIQVNKPKKVGGWKIYQSGYDAKLGKWSKTSIIELVNDPWLPVVYTGIFMLLAGALYMFWIGKDVKQPEKDEAQKSNN